MNYQDKLNYITLVYLSLTSVPQIESARILAVFPTPSISHQVIFRPIIQKLASRGHEVTVVTADPAFPKGDAPPNLTEIDVHNISYDMWQKEFMDNTVADPYLKMQLIFKLFNKLTNTQMKQIEVAKLIQDKNQKFDLLLLESCAVLTLGFSHIFKAPVIQISSLGAIYGNFHSVGAPLHPFLYPDQLRHRIHDLTLWEKLEQLYEQQKLIRCWLDHENEASILLKEQFSLDFPTIDELRKNIIMIFLNVRAMWDNNRPVPPGIVYIGGIHLNLENKLPKDLQEYLDGSVNGAVYVSLGTNVKPSLLAPEIKQMLLKVFSQLPYNFLLKWDADNFPDTPKNLKIMKWFPQSDVLSHPNVKLFITQGGLQSTDEAITAGVPVIGLPMLADQWYNAEKYVYHGIGMKLDLHTITDDELRNAINTIIGSSSYYENMRKLRDVLLDQPQPPLERAVWWIEYVIRHKGASHLRSPAANISWSEFLILDVVSVILAALLLCLIIFYVFVNLILRSISKRVKLKTK